MSYLLEFEPQSGKAAVLGSIVHQVFEWIGLLVKRGKTIDVEWLIDRAWDMYIENNAHLGLKRVNRNGESADFRLCRTSVNAVLSSPLYNPWTLNILDVEKRFDISMPGIAWTTPSGQFRITGYIDMVHEINPDTVEIVDWKTGRRTDYGSMKQKDFYDMMSDAQARIYHFAANQLYPKYKNILVTFYYINDGGPITLPYSVDDMIMTVGALWRIFKKIQTEELVTRSVSWKCSKFCQFGRMRVCDSIWKDFSDHNLAFVADKYRKMSLEKQQEYKEDNNGNIRTTS
jgi:hypothetical protein